MQGHGKGITRVGFSPSGTYLATAGLDRSVCIWSAATGGLLYSFNGTSSVLSLLWLPGGDELLICGLADGNIACLDIGGDFIEANGFLAHNQPVECLAIKDEYLVSGACEEVTVWNSILNVKASKYIMYEQIGDPSTTSQNEWQEILVTSVQWASPPEGPPLLVVTYMNHGVTLINADTWACENTFALDGQIASAAVSEDGTFIAISNVIRGFDIYSLSTGILLCSLDHDIRRTIPTQVHWIHGGLAVVGGSTAGQLTIWDVSHLSDHRAGDQNLGRGRVLYRLPLPEHAMSVAIAVSPTYSLVIASLFKSFRSGAFQCRG
ncbi:WD40-repeat-containing domain protein [Ganoderma leucocontextum]|nr:WD40-repeat-containing domain protein [Ganoderma leucocontextum]